MALNNARVCGDEMAKVPLNAEGTKGKTSAMLFISTNSNFCSGLLEKHIVDLEKSLATEKDHNGRSSFRG